MEVTVLKYIGEKKYVMNLLFLNVAFSIAAISPNYYFGSSKRNTTLRRVKIGNHECLKIRSIHKNKYA